MRQTFACGQQRVTLPRSFIRIAIAGCTLAEADEKVKKRMGRGIRRRVSRVTKVEEEDEKTHGIVTKGSILTTPSRTRLQFFLKSWHATGTDFCENAPGRVCILFEHRPITYIGSVGFFVFCVGRVGWSLINGTRERKIGIWGTGFI